MGPRSVRGVNDIYVVSVDASGQRRLARDAQFPAWSPDGRKIAFVRGVWPRPSEIYVMNADGSGQRRLTRDLAPDGFPAWSPDGRQIAYRQQPRRQLRDLRHERRRERAAEPDAQRGRLSLLPPGRPTGRRSPSEATATATGDLRHERRRERAAQPDAQRALGTGFLPGRPTGGRSHSSSAAA